MNSKIYSLLFKWLIGSLLILWPFLFVVIQVNDDAFVYFNYAKHLAQGGLFSYDARGIPSEGFTSLIYLLLLVPFQLLKISMPFAASIINIVALLLAAWIVSDLSKKLAPETKSTSWMVGAFFLFCMFVDKELIQLLGRGFESIINVLCYLVCLNVAFDVKEKPNLRGYFYFLLGFIVSILIRPENALLLLPLVIFVLKNMKKDKAFWSSTTAIMFFVSLGLVLKWLVFGDLFPTGFYRKLSGGQAGLEYLSEYFKNYGILITLGFAGFIWLIGNERKENSKNLLVLLGISFVLTLSFIFWVNPLVGYHFRYLILATSTLYFMLAFAAQKILSKVARLGGVAILGSVCFLFLGGIQKHRSDPSHLYKESIAQEEKHPYVRLAKFFQNEVKTPQDITMLFGDAGAIPYYFDCKFIDINGLTEPFLAKMFKEKKDRAIRVSDYTKNQNVDLAVLAVENSVMYPRKRDSQFLPHGPLSDPQEYRIWLKKQKEENFVYAGTVFGESYDLHFGLRKNSPHFHELDKVLSKYILQGNGRYLADDFIVEFSDGNIVFENIHKS